MSANIREWDVQVGTEMAWHKLTKVEKVITKRNCRIIYPMEMHVLPNPLTGEPTCYHAVFSMDNKLPIGGTVGEDYKLISNEQMMDMVDDALKGTKHQIVSVGSIGNREKVFCSIKLDNAILAANRETENTLNILWGHGGKFSVLARSGFVTVVCANTYAMALARKGEFELRVKHTGNADSKLENMAKAIDAHYGVVAEFKKAMDSFEQIPCNENRARNIFAGFLVRQLDEETEISTRTINTVDRLTQLFNDGNGNDGNDFSDVFNSFTDYFTHESSGGENRWKQFESSEFGVGFRRKTEAFKLLNGQEVKDLGNLKIVEDRGTKVLQLV